MSVLLKLERWNENIAKTLIVIAGIVTMLMASLTIADVAGRYLFNRPIPAAVEVGTEIIVAITFLCLPYVQLQRRQIHIDILISSVSPKARALLGLVTDVVILAIGSIWSYSAVRKAIESWLTGAASPGVFPVPYTPARALLAFGLLSFTLCVFLQIWRRLVQMTNPVPLREPAQE
ncbi:MAG: TRAP transporter small permease [Chloroflexi bacterium]|nr:TRAP transporter small permease [Chloroflexota bacterium]